MPASSLLALIDDVTTILDDVAVLSKVAARKTAGVLGDDLALNAQQVAGVNADRELPVVWAVAMGSLRNKAILVPAALAISAVAPWAVTPLLMIGGAYLCYEGFEKLAHRFLHSRADAEAEHRQLIAALAQPEIDMRTFERDKIRGAIRTDFILSAEIIAITLGTVADAGFATQVLVLSGVAVIMTIGVYGFVAGIVKLDDAGLHLSRKSADGGFARIERALGAALLALAPWLMKALSVVGTAAMFLVGGGILTHGIPGAHAFIEHLAQRAAGIPAIGTLLAAIAPPLLDALAGAIAGAIVLPAANAGTGLWRRWRAPPEATR